MPIILNFAFIVLLSTVLASCGDSNKNTIIVDTTNESMTTITTNFKLKDTNKDKELLTKFKGYELNQAVNFSGISEFTDKDEWGVRGKVYIIGKETPKDTNYDEYYEKKSKNGYLIVFDLRDYSYYKNAFEAPTNRKLIELTKEIADYCKVTEDDVKKAYTEKETEYKNCSDKITYIIKGRSDFTFPKQ